jgi:hypothetical protein
MRVLARLRPNHGTPSREILKRAHLGALTMNTNPVLWLQAYVIGVLIFLVSVTAITEHPEWFN